MDPSRVQCKRPRPPSPPTGAEGYRGEAGGQAKGCAGGSIAFNLNPPLGGARQCLWRSPAPARRPVNRRSERSARGGNVRRYGQVLGQDGRPAIVQSSDEVTTAVGTRLPRSERLVVLVRTVSNARWSSAGWFGPSIGAPSPSRSVTVRQRPAKPPGGHRLTGSGRRPPPAPGRPPSSPSTWHRTTADSLRRFPRRPSRAAGPPRPGARSAAPDRPRAIPAR
jgi:hypothetical protein